MELSDKSSRQLFANLYDMTIKYADVISFSDTMAQLRQVPPAR